MVIVSAPAIYGKTTAVADWARTHTGPEYILWLDAAAAADTGHVLQPLRQQIENPSQDNPHIRYRDTSLPLDELIVVIDNADQAPLRSTLANCIRMIRKSTGLRSIIITRTPSRIVARSQLLDIDVRTLSGRDLAMTAAEVRDAMPAGSTDADHAALLLYTEGNPYLVRSVSADLMLLPGPVNPKSIKDTVLKHSRRILKESHVACEFHDFLLSTCLPERLPADLAGELTGSDTHRKTLELLEVNEFIHRTADVEETYRYSFPVRAALLEELRSTEPDRVRQLSLIRAQYLEARGHTIEALQQAIDVDDYEAANTIAAANLSVLVGRAPEATLNVLNRLNLKEISRAPALCLVAGILGSRVGGNVVRAVEMLKLAEAGASSMNRPAERLRVEIIMMVALRMTGNLQQAVNAASAADALRGEADLALRSRHLDSEAFLDWQIGLTYVRAGLHDEAAPRLISAGAGFSRLDLPLLQGSAQNLMALSGAVAGRIDMARQTLSAHPRLGGLDPAVRILAEVLTSTSYGRQLPLRQVAEINASEFWVLGVVRRVYMDLRETGFCDVGDIEYTPNRTDRLPLTPRDMSQVIALVSLCHLVAGRYTPAAQCLEGRRPLPQILFARVRTGYVIGSYEGALSDLSRALEQNLSTRERATALILRSVALWHLGDNLGSREAAAAGINVIQDSGMGTGTLMIPEAEWETVEPLRIAIAENRIPRPNPILQSIERRPELTERELVVLRDLRQSRSAVQTAKTLHVSLNTVKSQSRSLYRKLGAKSLTEAIIIAERQGILSAR